jgi:serine phosphatase RsbU (regulator of sigma subunit)
VLILYTDGVTEAMNKRGDLFGEARLYSTISNQIAADARSIESGLLENIRLFSAGTTQGDDITTVIMKLQ